MVVVDKIPPNVFNVLSDLMAKAASCLFALALARLYPSMIMDSVQKGKPVPVEDLLGPPTLWESWMGVIKARRPFPSYWLLLAVPIFLTLDLAAHAGADIFLDFVTVEIGSEDRLFLGSAPGGIPSYKLLGDPIVQDYTVPAVLDESFLLSLDRIARGASRLSIFPPEYLVMQDAHELLSGIVRFTPFLLKTRGIVSKSPQWVPQRLNVVCNLTTDAYTQERWTEYTANASDFGLELSENDNAHAMRTVTYNSGYNSYENDPYTENITTQIHRQELLSIPKCDYETPVTYKTVQKNLDAEREWSVIDFSLFMAGSAYDGTDHEPFGARNEEGHLHWYLQFTDEETELPFTRQDGWQFGRSIRDNLVVVFGIDTDDNATHWNWYEPYLPVEGGIELEVEYSVLTGPGKDNQYADSTSGDDSWYTLSSWSHNCPLVNRSSGELIHGWFNQSGDFPGGCILDLDLHCVHRLPQDRMNASTHSEGQPKCQIKGIESMMVEGLDVDRSMLAAYAGIATRVEALNARNSLTHLSFRANSLAAAYIGTREIVKGTIATEGVRASFGIEYILLLLLPLWLIVPLLFFWRKDAAPIPSSIWHIMLLGNHQESVTAQNYSARNLEGFPPCPPKLKYGFVEEYDSNGGKPRLGLGNDAFLPVDSAPQRVRPVFSAKKQDESKEGGEEEEDMQAWHDTDVRVPPHHHANVVEPEITLADGSEGDNKIGTIKKAGKSKQSPKHHHHGHRHDKRHRKKKNPQRKQGAQHRQEDQDHRLANQV